MSRIGGGHAVAESCRAAGVLELSLRAERTSPASVKACTTRVLQCLAWCSEAQAPAVLDRRQVVRFVDSLLTRGVQPATPRSRQLGVRRFSAWLEDALAPADGGCPLAQVDVSDLEGRHLPGTGAGLDHDSQDGLVAPVT
jgi:hypothetical protein